jgi:hypothetical protein
MTEPFLMVIAAPSVGTYNAHTGDAGILYDDVWEMTVLAGFHPDLDVSMPYCPLMGA